MTTRRSVAGDEPHPRPLEKPHHPTVGNFSVKRRKEVQEDMASRGRMTMGDQLRSSGVGGRAGGVIIDEEEEAWIKDQEAAMAKAEAPAAKVVRKPSRFAQLKQQQAAELEKKQDQTPVEADASPIDKKRTALTDLMSVIAMPVKERDPNLVPVVAPKARTTAFPVPLPREKQAPAAPTPPVHAPRQAMEGALLGGRGDGGPGGGIPSRQEIHEENVALLEGMTDEEKREMLAEIQREVDPALLERMRKRASAKAAASPGGGKKVVTSASASSPPSTSSSALVGGETAGTTEKPAPREVSFAEGTEAGGGTSKLKLPKFVEEEMREGGQLCNLPPPTELDIQKMQWMGDLDEDDDSPAPPPPGSGPTPFATLRFDFDGAVPQGGEIDARGGLHNHAAAPKAPGYTIIELCSMARSSFQAQRATALGILEAVLERLSRGMLPAGLLDLFADTEAFRLFTANLSDASVTGSAAAAKAAFAFVRALAARRGGAVLDGEEMCVRGCEGFFWQGVDEAAACLMWEGTSKGKDRGKLTERESGVLGEAWERMVRTDMLRGMLEEGLVQNCTSLLSSTGGSATMHLPLINLLTMVAQHSPHAAQQVASSPALPALLVDRFVHNSHGGGEAVSVRACAIRLVKALCQASAETCRSLADEGLLDSIKAVILPGGGLGLVQGSSWPAGVGSSRPDALEGLRLWRVSLHYGLNAHALPDLSTALQEAACRGGAEGREVLLMMEAATVAARPGGAQVVSWRHIESWFPTFEQCVVSKECGGEAMHCMAAYFESLKGNERGGGKAVYGDDADRILSTICLGDSMWSASGPTQRIEALLDACFALTELPPGDVVASQGADLPGTYQWVWGWVRLMAAILKIREGAQCSVLGKLEELAKALIKVVKRASQPPPDTALLPLRLRTPAALHLSLLELMPLLPSKAWGGETSAGASILVSSGLAAACRLGGGDEAELMWVMASCVAVPSRMKQMIEGMPPSQAAVMPRWVGGGSEGAACAVCESLLRWAEGVAAASGEDALARSTSLFVGSPHRVKSLSRPLNSPTLPLRNDLSLMPVRVLISARGMKDGRGGDDTDDLLSDTGPQSAHVRNVVNVRAWRASANVVNGSLSLTLLLVQSESPFLFSPMGLGRGGVWHRVASTYLLGEDMFRHSSTAPLLSALLASLSASSWHLGDGNAPSISLEIPPSSHKALHELSLGFAAESCGDAGYAQVIISSLQRHVPADLRFPIWSELAPYLLRLLRPLESGPPGGVGAYLFPPEDDDRMIGSYIEALRGGALATVPFMFWLAVHHVSCNLFGSWDVEQEGVLAGKSSALEDLINCPVRVYDAVCTYRVCQGVPQAMQGGEQNWQEPKWRMAALAEWCMAVKWRADKIRDDGSVLAAHLDG